MLEIEIEPTDLLFIDTVHTAGQVSRELELHGGRARRYLAFHDVETFGWHDEVGTGAGLVVPIVNWLGSNGFEVIEWHRNCNGLLVARRR